MKCPICGCENPEGYKFCHDCGNPLIIQDFDENDSYPSFDSKCLIMVGYIIAI